MLYDIKLKLHSISGDVPHELSCGNTMLCNEPFLPILLLCAFGIILVHCCIHHYADVASCDSIICQWWVCILFWSQYFISVHVSPPASLGLTTTQKLISYSTPKFSSLIYVTCSKKHRTDWTLQPYIIASVWHLRYILQCLSHGSAQFSRYNLQHDFYLVWLDMEYLRW